MNLPGTGFAFQQTASGHCVTPLRDLGPADHFAWWVNTPEFPPFLGEGPKQLEDDIVVTRGSRGVLVFPTTDLVDNLFVKRLIPWSPYYPTVAQLALRKRKPPGVSGELDLLQLAFQLSECHEEPEVPERYLEFARIYGPLGTDQLPILPDGVGPKFLVEDYFDWVLQSIYLQEVLGLWLQESVEGNDRQTQFKMEQLVARHLGSSVGLYPVKAKRKGGRTYRTVPRSLIAALWLAVWTDYSEGTEIGRCRVCNAWFSARGHQKSGIPKKSCSNTCNQRAKYHRDKATNGNSR